MKNGMVSALQKTRNAAFLSAPSAVISISAIAIIIISPTAR